MPWRQNAYTYKTSLRKEIKYIQVCGEKSSIKIIYTSDDLKAMKSLMKITGKQGNRGREIGGGGSIWI